MIRSFVQLIEMCCWLSVFLLQSTCSEKRKKNTKCKHFSAAVSKLKVKCRFLNTALDTTDVQQTQIYTVHWRCSVVCRFPFRGQRLWKTHTCTKSPKSKTKYGSILFHAPHTVAQSGDSECIRVWLSVYAVWQWPRQKISCICKPIQCRFAEC